MNYWLMKSEPSVYGWDNLVKDKRTSWSGVRNYQASNNLKAMKIGDRAFFYHSNEGLAVVGIMEVVKTYYPDPSDKTQRFGMVDVKPVQAILEEDGAELILFEHRHFHSAYIRGEEGPFALVGGPSASAAHGAPEELARYYLFRIGREKGEWRCGMVSRGMTVPDGPIVEIDRMTLTG